MHLLSPSEAVPREVELHGVQIVESVGCKAAGLARMPVYGAEALCPREMDPQLDYETPGALLPVLTGRNQERQIRSE